MIQQSQSWASIQRKPRLAKTHVLQCSLQHYFAIAKTWKQPKCPTTEEWIKKMWYIYTMEYYSAIKRNKIPAFYFLFFIFLFFLSFRYFFGPLPRHMEVPRLGVELELQPLAYARATTTLDLSRVCNLHHSSRQCRILNPLIKARNRTCNLMVSSQIP